MDRKPKLIMLNGFAGCGKSTIAKKYIDEHPLAMNLEGDQLIVMLGHWKDNWKAAEKCKIDLSKVVAKSQLQSGYDVMIPFLLTDPKHAEDFESIAKDTGSEFFEIMLFVERDEAIARLHKRGRWGEAGSPSFTEEDFPQIEKLYDTMIEATSKRPNTINIDTVEGDIDQTYEKLLEVIN